MLWDEVLTALGQSRGYVSGAELSRRFGVTRAGIHVTVERLREAGYEIVSARKRGYRLLGGPDSLGIGDLAMHLPKERLAAVRCLKEVDSTNRYLKELAEEKLPEGFTVIADKQTKGRGRYGRFFASPAGDGLYLSMLLRNAGDPRALRDVTAYAAVATANAIRRVTGICPDIKWVNDLQMHERKICGILTELSLKAESAEVQSCVVGIGINVRSGADFPEELREIAGSIEGEYPDVRVRRAALAAALIEELDRLREDFPSRKEEYLASYRELCVTRGPVVLRDASGERKALALGIDEDFSLLVEYPDGTRGSVRSGEVSARKLPRSEP